MSVEPSVIRSRRFLSTFASSPLPASIKVLSSCSVRVGCVAGAGAADAERDVAPPYCKRQIRSITPPRGGSVAQRNNTKKGDSQRTRAASSAF